MGRTFRSNTTRFDDESTSGRRNKHAKHANNHKAKGMRIINLPDYAEDDDGDYFDDEVSVQDSITINKYSEQ